MPPNSASSAAGGAEARARMAATTMPNTSARTVLEEMKIWPPINTARWPTLAVLSALAPNLTA
jgi:hypothetical protein